MPIYYIPKSSLKLSNRSYHTTPWINAKARPRRAFQKQELPLDCVFKVIAVVTPPNYFLPVCIHIIILFHMIKRWVINVPSIHSIGSFTDLCFYISQWQKKTSKDCIGSGFIVNTKYGRKLFTNAHVVDHATTVCFTRFQAFELVLTFDFPQVLIRRGGSTNSYIAKVVAVGYDCDLAELKVSDEFFLDDSYVEGEGRGEELQGLELGELPELHSRVTVIGYPTGGDNVSVTRGVVSRIEPQQYAFSMVHHLLAIQIDAAINPGNSGGPALDNDNKIVGVAFQSLMGAENIGYIIPTPVIEHFIEDVHKNGKYLGFSRLGIHTQILDQAYAAREYLKMAKNMVCKVSMFICPSIHTNHDMA